jgi:hypothetical protein
MTPQKRKVFISHFKGDRTEVGNFINTFGYVFIPKILGANDNDDFINSTNTDYVMRRIRDKYLEDSSVTLVLIGSCTHSRRYVDWEIKSSLQQGQGTPNGLLGIVLPSQNNNALLPQRFKANWTKGHINCYARYKSYPRTDQELREYIEDAYLARTTRAHLIANSNSMMGYNSKCCVCDVTHR